MSEDKQQPEAVYVWWSDMDQQWRIRKWDMQPFVEGTKYTREGALPSTAAVASAPPSLEQGKEAGAQLDAIAAVLGYPKETWRIASCEFLAHAVRDLQNNYIAARDAYAGLKGTTDALLNTPPSSSGPHESAPETDEQRAARIREVAPSATECKSTKEK